MVELLDLAGQPAKRIFDIGEFLQTLVERSDARILSLFALLARGLLLIAFAKELSDSRLVRLRRHARNSFLQQTGFRPRSQNAQTEFVLGHRLGRTGLSAHASAQKGDAGKRRPASSKTKYAHPHRRPLPSRILRGPL